MLTKREVEGLMLALARTRGSRGYTIEEASLILDDALRVKTLAQYYEGAINGTINLDVRDPDIAFIV